MIKGFSFVLVSVVMVVMLVFGLLAVSTTGADLRLSDKALTAQKIYYGLDSDGEQLIADCENAISKSQNLTDEFISEKKYNKPLPDDFFECLAPYISQLKINPNGKNSEYIKRGIFFYYLNTELSNISEINYTINQDTLKSVLSKTASVEEIITTLNATIISNVDDKNSLQISMQLPFGDISKTPDFVITNRSIKVSGLRINEDQPINVWDGN